MVFSDVGGFGELALEHGFGRLVPPGEPYALAAAIQELLATPPSASDWRSVRLPRPRGALLWDRIAEQTPPPVRGARA